MNKMQRTGLLPLLLLGLAIGCSGRPQMVPVSGTVTHQGQRVEGADVMFSPKGGRIASGRTDKEGRFQLTTFVAGDGALEGEHGVSVAKMQLIMDSKDPDNPYPHARNLLPAKYSNVESSGITVSVKRGGDNQITIQLEP